MNSTNSPAQIQSNDQQQGYNGWANYETWLVYLHISNDYCGDIFFEDAFMEVGNRVDLAHELKEFFEANSPLAEDCSMYTDLLHNALSAVDWFEITQAILEDFVDEEAPTVN